MVVMVESACNHKLEASLFDDLLNMMRKYKGSSHCSGYKSEIPAFSASRSQSKSLGPGEIILFDHVWTNVGNGYNPNTGKFTAPKSGLYQISGTVMSAHGKYLNVYLFKNDKQTVSLFAGLGNNTGTVNIVLKLQKGETVYMKHHNNTETIHSTSSVYCVFSGFLISVISTRC